MKNLYYIKSGLFKLIRLFPYLKKEDTYFII